MWAPSERATEPVKANLKLNADGSNEGNDETGSRGLSDFNDGTLYTHNSEVDESDTASCCGVPIRKTTAERRITAQRPPLSKVILVVVLLAC